MNWQELSNQHKTLETCFSPLVDQATCDAKQQSNHDLDLSGFPPLFANFLRTIGSNAPHLQHLMMQDADRLKTLCSSGFDAFLSGATERLIAGLTGAVEDAEAMVHLRQYKQATSLSIALWDLADAVPQTAILAALSQAAELSVEAGLRYLITREIAAGKCNFELPEEGLEGLGFVLLGMGKLGAWELNYSSDIDLIALYDQDVRSLADGQEASVFWVRLIKRLVRLMQERTGDGYVYRMDLRLRPDPGSTPLAVSLAGALQYYEGTGQNWERAALIKARPIAGDKTVGEVFLTRVSPFIWRKYLDYAAIEDIQAIKRQIHAHKGFGQICSAGHNIKLGRGGIREIEFFVQTQQLIAGGRNSDLRNRKTLNGLEQLRDIGWVEQTVCHELSEAYDYLRRVENRIQMMDDEQTHIIPQDEPKRLSLAVLSSATDLDSFDQQLIATFTTVQRHYAHLFEEKNGSENTSGNLVFSGEDDDPDTMQTLSGLGFARPSDAIALIKGWHFGRIPATRSEHARTVLTELMPTLLRHMSDSGQPDVAMAGFDRFLKGLPAGLQLFSLLKSNPELLSLLSVILGAAPRLANTITRRPHVLDALLDPGFFGTDFTVEDMTAHLQQSLALSLGFEDALDRARIFTQEQLFLIGTRILSGTLTASETGRAYTGLAEAVIWKMLQETQKDFVKRHGIVAGAKLCVVAMGKLGNREMTATSDLDLMLIYDFNEGVTQSDGRRPLAVSQYFMRLTQRLITALSAPTGEGLLYEIDMRLRPSGNAGPLATQFQTFVNYQNDQAWTWERMALTRARPICGDNELCQKMREAIAAALGNQNADVLKTDAAEMLAKIHDAKPPAHIWDVKTAPGGVVDIEFVAQVLQLQNAETNIEILQGNTRNALRKAVDLGLIAAADGDLLIEAHRFYEGLQQLIRMAFDGGESRTDFLEQPGFLPILARACELPDVDMIAVQLNDYQAEVAELVKRFFKD
ncbi:bifunctional [glutamine synthetase] adenylyltransferase/[glutamine synthetase]-adenylyl-L-tyrosine phosphorylase [Pararhizobium sp. IMCC21322]|uniref:bifunctional [glutamine synthetase] adenylyltransferase/[glutamine synthetase]-adenylyl-L-tyrosine phosphorylase n=1 Tax=Pararhizobium sp. IMCC21322 TaxID=3067903 RepID=UPI0027411EBE|nr:bifunctional [glutamine synthetase] adenylyltransferase/[glutamine synthetase]-adenylyl-L-tyrosine phosphorylase [Pararhizobium sp. IMCC21322]